jgi:prepilin-type N-terminal cleavage/methylation domain-containing protein
MRGFTLLEVICVISIMILIGSLAFFSHHTLKKELNLQRSSYLLAQGLREAQELAMAMKKFGCPSNLRLVGYGVNLAKDNDFFSLRARCQNETQIQDPEVKRINFEKGVKIEDLKKDQSKVTSLNIFFYPPDPEVDLEGATSSEIILAAEDLPESKSITVNSVGLIEIK